MTWTQNYTPLFDSLAASALVGVLVLLQAYVFLGVVL